MLAREKKKVNRFDRKD